MEKINLGTGINLDNVTLEDCIDLYDKKDTYTIIGNGKVVGFCREDSKR